MWKMPCSENSGELDFRERLFVFLPQGFGVMMGKPRQEALNSVRRWVNSENETSGIIVTCQTTGQWTHTEVWWASLAVVGAGSTWHVVFRL